MSVLSTILFETLQKAPFYRNIFHQALQLVEGIAGRSWLDVGCGPGELARMSVGNGFQTVGLDLDPGMIKRARKLSRGLPNTPRFHQGQLNELPPGTFDVVSAASFLAVVPNTRAMVDQLWSRVRPGGMLLIIEPTSLMHPQFLKEHPLPPGKHRWLAGLWARARQHNTVSPQHWLRLDSQKTHQMAAMDGMVGIWLLKKSLSQQEAS
jgi:2-polyprenyl-3-methyl-5-hydroxy-6-metoxy-1,4-benzoquinol methylase